MPEPKLVERLKQGVIVIGFGPGQGEMVDVVTANQAMRKAADRIERLEAALRKARDKFREYEQLHRLKNTPEGVEKAKRNCEVADELSAALSASNEGEE